MPGYTELKTRFCRDLLAFLNLRPDVDLEDIDHATPEMDFNLGTVRDNKRIHSRSGDRIFITELTGVAYIRTRLKGAKYKLRVGNISLPFKNLFLTNTAQAGKTLSLIVGYGAYIDFAVSYLAVKILNIGNIEINPSTEEKQDITIAQLDIKLSALRDAICDSAAPKDLKDLYDQLYAMRGAASPKNLKQIWDVLTTIAGLDFATDTGLAVIAGLDFAEQTTLALIKAKTDNLDLAITDLRDAICDTINPKDLYDLYVKLNIIAGKNFATQSTLLLIKAKTDLLADIPKEATETPVIYNTMITPPDTEFSQALPAGTKQLTFFLKDLSTFRYAWVTGKVAGAIPPYVEVPAGGFVFLDKLNWTDKTLYYSCSGTSKIMIIEVLT